MQKQNVLFDLDDTLIHCNRHFISTREKFSDLMLELFNEFPISREILQDTQKRVDIAGVEKFGLGRDRFPKSLVETYRLMSGKYGRRADKHEEDEILKIGFSVYEFEVELYPHAIETLQILQEEGHHLYLFTGGDFQIQNRKVFEAGLDLIFPEKRRFVTEHKNTISLKKVLKKARLLPVSTWMVGNSQRNDIRPALELGLHAIHVPDQFGWDYDQIEIDIPAKGQFNILPSIREVPEVIRNYVRGESELRGHMG